jgi:hypothetical protein
VFTYTGRQNTDDMNWNMNIELLFVVLKYDIFQIMKNKEMETLKYE